MSLTKRRRINFYSTSPRIERRNYFSFNLFNTVRIETLVTLTIWQLHCVPRPTLTDLQLHCVSGLQEENKCAGCEPGMYCPVPGLTSPHGNCSARYYCSGNATNSAPTDGVTGDKCPVGSYCPAGSGSPVPCPDGSFTDTELNEECLACMPGHYCVNGVTPPVHCPAGFYCPEGECLWFWVTFSWNVERDKCL